MCHTHLTNLDLIIQIIATNINNTLTLIHNFS
jgi:hypothetical protein